jgi:hypothetical protein
MGGKTAWAVIEMTLQNTQDSIEAGLLRKIADIRSKVVGGICNGQWANFMLQQIAEDNHEADLIFQPALVTLKRPPLSEIAGWIETEYAHDSCGIQAGARPRLSRMSWSDGPDEVTLTAATMESLFLHGWNVEETEHLMLETAAKLGLRRCPDWVVPALCLHAEHKGENVPAGRSFSRSFNFCLASDSARTGGLGMRFHEGWALYGRSRDLVAPWSSSMGWIFVKPKVGILPE